MVTIAAIIDRSTAISATPPPQPLNNEQATHTAMGER
jgi:hypothetical protein